MVKFECDHTKQEHQIQVGQVKTGDFQPKSCYIKELVEDKETVIMKG